MFATEITSVMHYTGFDDISSHRDTELLQLNLLRDQYSKFPRNPNIPCEGNLSCLWTRGIKISCGKIVHMFISGSTMYKITIRTVWFSSLWSQFPRGNPEILHGINFPCLITPEWWGAFVVVCLGHDADYHMAQLMPLLPFTVSCCSKCRLVLPFWFQLIRVVLEKGPLNGCCCCCCNNTWNFNSMLIHTHTTHNRFTAGLEYVWVHPGQQVPER